MLSSLHRLEEIDKQMLEFKIQIICAMKIAGNVVLGRLSIG